MLFSDCKTLDLHGETREIARILVNEFIDDCYRMKEEKVIIIHGIGSGILRKEVSNVLKHNPKVAHYSIDFFNAGQTIVELKDNV